MPVILFHTSLFVCLFLQKKAGAVAHGRKLVTVIILNGQKLNFMIEVRVAFFQNCNFLEGNGA